MKFKVFISSVQREFAKERLAIAKLIRTDRLLRHFFEPYVFEETAATGKRAQKVYLDAVGECDIYLSLIGETYGNADAEGTSPTEREYDKAVACGKERLVFVKDPSENRSPEEGAFLDKISNDITWSPFTTIRSLEDAVYEALFAWLQGRYLVTDKPFDKSTSREVQMSDLDEEKFAAYIKLVREAKKVSLPNHVTSKDILTRIGAIDKKTGRITNGAIPLFAKHPEEIKTIIWRNGYGPAAKRDPVAGPSRGIQSAPSQRAQSGARVRGPSRGPKSGAQVGGPERAQKALSLGTKSALSRGTKSGDVGFNNGEQIILYCKVPRSAVEIMTLFGRSDRTKFKKAVLNSLMSDMLLEYTIPDKPNSRLQKYRLTAKGRRLATSLAKKGRS